jgi:hypothetical protein
MADSENDEDEVVVTYIPHHQQELLDLLPNRWSPPFFNKILSQDHFYGPSNTSTALSNRDQCFADSMVLLSQRTTEELELILQNRIPLGRHQLRRPGNDVLTKDPTIYINYIVDVNKLGIPIDEFPLFLAGLIIWADIEMPDELSGVCTRDKAYMRQRVESKYTTAGRTKTFLQTVNEGTLREKLWEFVRYYLDDVLPTAGAQKQHIDGEEFPVTHIMLPGEVGLAEIGNSRCKAHRAYSSSPDLFRLIRLVLRVLLPRGWDLDQVFVFEMTRASQTSIGESIASILCGSYHSTGGLNLTQAGISMTGAINLSIPTWSDVVFAMMRRQVWANMEHHQGIIKALAKSNGERARHIEDDRKYRERVTELEQIAVAIAQGAGAVEATVNEMTAVMGGVQQDIKERSERREALRVAEESLKDLGDALESLEL